METLEIKNFLSLAEARIEVKPFTILIGPQAQGKSAIAKLLYFFRDLTSRRFARSVEESAPEQYLRTVAASRFEKLFPRYSWNQKGFLIKYSSGEFGVTLRNSVGEPIHNGITIELSPSLSKLLRDAQIDFYKRLSGDDQTFHEPEAPMQTSLELREQAVRQVFESGSASQLLDSTVYLPAGRSFFANFESGLWGLLAREISIDPLMAEFGEVYDASRRSFIRGLAPPVAPSGDIGVKLTEEFEEIVKGRYIRLDDQDWIVSGNRRTLLAQASSGQQETLPIMLILSARALDNEEEQRTTFFIEEPEAAIFPRSQQALVEVFARLHNLAAHTFFLTTHSPYVLTALNNLVAASNIASRGEQAKEQASKVVDPAMMISGESVSTYYVDGGTVKDIFDYEVNLIGVNEIDSASEDLGGIFDRLMEIQIGLQ